MCQFLHVPDSYFQCVDFPVSIKWKIKLAPKTPSLWIIWGCFPDFIFLLWLANNRDGPLRLRPSELCICQQVMSPYFLEALFLGNEAVFLSLLGTVWRLFLARAPTISSPWSLRSRPKQVLIIDSPVPKIT